MDNADHATVPFPGIPVSWDLHEDELTIYYPMDAVTGIQPKAVIRSTVPWTMPTIHATLAEHGLREAPRGHRATDAIVTAVAGIVAAGERIAAAGAALNRAVAIAMAPAHAGPRP